MSTMTSMMTKLGMSPVNADTAAAKSRITTNGLLNRPRKAISKPFRLAISIWFGPLALKMSAASDAPSVECKLCRRSDSGKRGHVRYPRRPWLSRVLARSFCLLVDYLRFERRHLVYLSFKARAVL